MELIELRNSSALTVFCSKFKKKDRHSRLDGGVHSDEIAGKVASECAGSILAKSTCANVLTLASEINGHRGPCWPRCPGAITAVLFREFQQ